MAETPRAVAGDSTCRVDVIGAQLCSCARAVFPWVALFWSARSLPLIIVGKSTNMRNTGFFLDCYLLSVTDGSIWIRYAEIFKKPNFQVPEWKSTFIWKMLSQAEWETEGSRLVQSFFCLPPLIWNVISRFPINNIISLSWISNLNQ